jgi:hypothetical protein
MSKLTSRTLATGATLGDLIHIVITGDTSQNPAGSSYKASLSQLQPLFLFSGGSGNCINDLYVDGVHACVDEITIYDRVQSDGSDAQNTLSFAFGKQVQALGDFSHAEGDNTIANGVASHTEGLKTITYGEYSHAEGELSQTGVNNAYTVTGITNGVIALDPTYGNVTGNWTVGGYIYLYAIPYEDSYEVSNVTFASGTTVISITDTSVNASSGFIGDTSPLPIYWGGDQTIGGVKAHAGGKNSFAIGEASTAIGWTSITYGPYSFASGYNSIAYAYDSTAINGGQAFGTQSFAEGPSIARGRYSHSENNGTANGANSHAEGSGTANGMSSHAEGSSTASGVFSHAEGDSTVASGQYSHSQNKGTEASGDNSHAGGVGTVAYGIVSFAHGDNNESLGDLSVSLGGENNIVNTGDTGSSIIIGGVENKISGLTGSDPVYRSSIIGGNLNEVNGFNSAIISSEGSKVTSDHIVVIGGHGMTGTTNDTVYVPNIVLYPSYSYTPTGTTDNTVGEVGSVTWDNNYFYYRDNIGWKRISGATW